MPNTKIVQVPHLGGISAAYQTPHPIDHAKPTVILVNSMTTSSELYQDQFKDERLTSVMNLVAIELLGHGQTRTKSEHWTYWDTALMNLQVMEKLGIEKAYVLGTSQGGWVTVRMALLAPERIQGIIPLGTSMDYESERSRSLGCWNALELVTHTIGAFTSSQPTPDFVPSDEYCGYLVQNGFGPEVSEDVMTFWKKEIQFNYQGDDGRKRARMAAINLRDRDGLLGRVGDVRCPVLWMHGTRDITYSVANAQEEIKLFKNSPDAKVVPVEGGHHFLSSSSPEEVASNLLEFVKKYSNLKSQS